MYGVFEKGQFGSLINVFQFYSVRAKFGATRRYQKTGYVEIDSERIILNEKYSAEVYDVQPPDFDIGLIKLKRGMKDFSKFLL